MRTNDSDKSGPQEDARKVLIQRFMECMSWSAPDSHSACFAAVCWRLDKICSVLLLVSLNVFCSLIGEPE